MSAAALILARWAYRLIDTKGVAAHSEIIQAAVWWSVLQAAASTSAARQLVTLEGDDTFPAVAGLTMLAMMLPVYWDDLGTAERASALGATVATAALGLWLRRKPVRWERIAGELIWLGAASLSVLKVRRSLERDAARQGAKLAERDEDERRSAYNKGRSFVIGLVTQERNEARRVFCSLRDELPSDIAAEAERRLAEIDKRLELLRCGPAS